jgi:GT2 family glycosyltransferase
MRQAATGSSKVAIVIVNWNGWRDTVECLESLRHLVYPDYRVIVIDNGSTDASVERLKPLAGGQIELIETGRNLGFAGGNNVGLRRALQEPAVEYFWLLNNDTVVDPDALARLVERLKEKSGAGICGSTVVNYRERDRVEAWGGAFYDKWLAVARHLGQGKPLAAPIDVAKVERRLGYILGASLLVSRAFLREIGLLAEEYFIYCEEIDWAARARGRYTLAYAPKSIVYHKGGSSVGSAGSGFAKYYEMRNRLLVTRKNFPYAYPTVYLGVVVEMIGMFLRGERAGAQVVWAVLNNVPWEQLNRSLH